MYWHRPNAIYFCNVYLIIEYIDHRVIRVYSVWVVHFDYDITIGSFELIHFLWDKYNLVKGNTKDRQITLRLIHREIWTLCILKEL